MTLETEERWMPSHVVEHRSLVLDGDVCDQATHSRWTPEQRQLATISCSLRHREEPLPASTRKKDLSLMAARRNEAVGRPR